MTLIKNYLYNLSILLLQVGTPLITIPYVSRIFVPELIGEGVFAASVAKWLVVFAQLGIATYGIRVISTSSKTLRIKRFWQLFSLNFVMTFIMSVVYSIGVLIWAKDPLLFWIQGLLLFLTFFEIGWYFSGIQDFKSGLYRSLITKGVSILLILTLVKTAEDFHVFLLIQAGSLFLGALFHFGVGPKLNTFKKSFLNISHLWYHLKKGRSFLVLAIFINVYTLLDKIIVGSISTPHELGLYEMTFRIVLTLMVFSISAGGVLLPKSAELMAQKREKNWLTFVNAGFLWAFFSSFLISSFMILFYEEFVLLFLGDKYLEISELMNFVPLLVLLLSLNNVTSQQILIPVKKERLLNRTVWVAATISLLSNFGFVPIWGAVGALLAWSLTELGSTTIQMYFSRAYYDLKSFFMSLFGWVFILVTLVFFKNQTYFELDWIGKGTIWIFVISIVGLFVLKRFRTYHRDIKFDQNGIK